MSASHTGEPSARLQAAQQALLALRQQHGIADAIMPRLAPGASVTLLFAQDTLLRRRRAEKGGVADAPFQPTIVAATDSPDDAPLISTTKPEPAQIAVYPSLLLEIYKQRLETVARIYLLGKHLDRDGRGWFEITTMRRLLTGEQSRYRVCGWRRLRQLLKAGEGIFWHRCSKDRLWLYSIKRVAVTLNIRRLRGATVELDIDTLLGGIQTVRAQFYAAYHSSRSNSPISRGTLKQITGVPERTQRSYDTIAGVKRQRNIAIGAPHSAEIAREQAWQRGGAVFRFIDSHGRQGPKNRCYIAWHLPNSYQGPHQRCGRRRQKAINQQLTDLAHVGTRGNGQEQVERIFWPTSGAAARACHKQTTADLYWPQNSTGPQSSMVWNSMSKKK